ncbi:unnamed protein product, partial [Rodentolepis nana]
MEADHNPRPGVSRVGSQKEGPLKHIDVELVEVLSKHNTRSDRSRFFVNTASAGSGALSVTVDGPSKVQLNCTERMDGYEFSYTPYAPGNYNISITYDGHPITHSPFRAYVTGDAVFGYTEDTAQLIVNTNGRMVTGPQRSMGYSQADA